MSIESWIYGNLNSKDPVIQEYNTRLCSNGFIRVKGELELLSKRIMSTMWRNGERTIAQCWFAGFVKPDLYVIALGTEQNTLLGKQFTGTRGLFCTLAIGFSGSDIKSYRQDNGLFDPLKDILCTMNEKCTGDEENLPVISLVELQKYICIPTEEFLRSHCERYCIEENPPVQIPELDQYNMFLSDTSLDSALWTLSRNRPVALGLLCENDGEQLLGMYPQGVVTVIDGISRKYSGGVKKTAIQRHMEEEQQRAKAEEKRKEEVARKVKEQQNKNLNKVKSSERKTVDRDTIAAMKKEINGVIDSLLKEESQSNFVDRLKRLKVKQKVQKYCYEYILRKGCPKDENELQSLVKNAIECCSEKEK